MVRMLRPTTFVPARTASGRGCRIPAGVGTELKALFGLART